MLVADPAAQHAAAAINVDKRAFLAGAELRGSVVVSAKQPIECSAVTVTVLGSEKVNWNFSRGPSIFRKKDEVCFSHQIPVCESPLKLAAGRQREFQFACELPSGLPGSFQLPSLVTPTARIKYVAASIEYAVHVTVDFTTADAQDDTSNKPRRALQLREREPITIHEDPSGRLTATIPRDDAFLGVRVRSRWRCCYTKGSYDFKISVAGDMCGLGSELVLQCDLNNASSVAVTSIKCRLVQVITLQLRTIEHSVEREIASWSCADVPPHQHTVWSQTIQTTRPDGGVHPSTGNGKVVKCTYAVLAEASATGSIGVVLRIPVTIVSPPLSGSDPPPP